MLILIGVRTMTIKELKQFIASSGLKDSNSVLLHTYTSNDQICQIVPLKIGNNFDCQEKLGFPKDESLILHA